MVAAGGLCVDGTVDDTVLELLTDQPVIDAPPCVVLSRPESIGPP